jgi:hypothetical protein
MIRFTVRNITDAIPRESFTVEARDLLALGEMLDARVDVHYCNRALLRGWGGSSWEVTWTDADRLGATNSLRQPANT